MLEGLARVEGMLSERFEEITNKCEGKIFQWGSSGEGSSE